MTHRTLRLRIFATSNFHGAGISQMPLSEFFSVTSGYLGRTSTFSKKAVKLSHTKERFSRSRFQKKCNPETLFQSFVSLRYRIFQRIKECSLKLCSSYFLKNLLCVTFAHQLLRLFVHQCHKEMTTINGIAKLITKKRSSKALQNGTGLPKCMPEIYPEIIEMQC